MRRNPAKNDFQQWMPLILDSLRAVGGQAKPREVLAWIKELKSPLDSYLEETLASGQTRFYNQVHWARQHLAWEGLVDDSRRGVWSLTPLGWKEKLDEKSASEIVRRRLRKADSGIGNQKSDLIAIDLAEVPPPDEIQDQQLLDVLKGLSPIGFERICQRLMSEHGFENVVVTQQSRDGGIDGFGTLRLSAFVTLKVAFQAKRYKDVVSRAAVGEFRNALLGRAEKGVFITTGRFTADAWAEAGRDGVVPIELVDGERLVELFEEKQLGVRPKQILEIDHAFFVEFQS